MFRHEAMLDVGYWWQFGGASVIGELECDDYSVCAFENRTEKPYQK